jgi:hypothetical protein
MINLARLPGMPPEGLTWRINKAGTAILAQGFADADLSVTQPSFGTVLGGEISPVHLEAGDYDLVLGGTGAEIDTIWNGGQSKIIPQTSHNLAGKQATVSTLSALRALRVPSRDMSVQVMWRAYIGDGGGGVFGWNANDQSALVVQDPYSGVFVAPDSDPTGASGAWVRLFSGKLNVRAFGARGNDIDSDTGPFQGAVDLLYNVFGRGLLYMPTGVYRLTAPIQWRSRISLCGDGMGQSTFTMHGVRFSAIEQTSESDPDGYNPDAVGLDDCHFYDFEIDGSGLTSLDDHPAGKGFFILYMRRSSFRRIYIHHTIGTGLGCDFLTDTLIHGVLAHHCGRNRVSGVGQSGIGIGTGWENAESVIISDCQTNFNGNYGIFVERQGNDQPQSSRGARIVNCYAEGNRVGFGNARSGGTTFANCEAIDSSEMGFSVVCDPIAETPNRLINCHSLRSGADGFELVYGGPEDQLTGCTSIASGGRGFYMSSSRGPQMTACKALDSALAGFVFSGTGVNGDLTLNDCHAMRNGLEGIYIQDKIDPVTLNNCRSEKNGKAGLYYTQSAGSPDSDLITINGGSYRENGETGVTLFPKKAAKGIMLNGVTIKDNGQALVSGKRAGLVIAGIVYDGLMTGCHIGNTKGLATQSECVNALFTVDPYNEFNILANNFKNPLGNPLVLTNWGTSVVRGNIGYGNSPPTPIGITASPMTLPVRYSDSIIYFEGTGVNMTINGIATLYMTDFGTVFVPANATAVINYTTLARVKLALL